MFNKRHLDTEPSLSSVNLFQYSMIKIVHELLVLAMRATCPALLDLSALTTLVYGN